MLLHQIVSFIVFPKAYPIILAWNHSIHMPYRRCRSWKDKGEGRLGRNIANMTIRTITSHLILLHYLDWKVIIFFKVYMMYNILTKVSDIKYSVTFNFKKVLNNSICPSRSNIAKTTLSKNSYFFSPPPPSTNLRRTEIRGTLTSQLSSLALLFLSGWPSDRDEGDLVIGNDRLVSSSSIGLSAKQGFE